MFYRTSLEFLKSWRENTDRKPLILRGARQVGKTTLVRMFSKYFTNYVELNLEKPEDNNLFSEKLNLAEIIQKISLSKNVKLTGGNVLLFIDEIQNSPYAISLMRYFYEDYRNIYVIAAGSLLDAIIRPDQISFPVGRVEYHFIFPATFNEFLHAVNRKAWEEYNKLPAADYAHQELLKLFHNYVMLGGMPEVIENWLQEREILSLKKIYRNLLVSYIDDISKYARNKTMVEILRHAINSVILEAGNRITFAGFGRSNYRSREMGEALRTLQNVQLIDLIYPTTSTEIPLIPNTRKKPKLQFLDTGLINYSVELFNEYIGIEDLNSVYKGKIIEHIVGQELKVILAQEAKKLSFWVREKKQSQAEIDFIISYNNKLVPVEVKSGSTSRMKSLQQFMKKSSGNFAVRIYAKKFHLEKLTLPLGKKIILMNLPYYQTGKLYEYLKKYFTTKV